MTKQECHKTRALQNRNIPKYQFIECKRHKTLGQDIKLNLEQKVGRTLGIFLTFFVSNQKSYLKSVATLQQVVKVHMPHLHCPLKPLAFTRNTQNIKVTKDHFIEHEHPKALQKIKFDLEQKIGNNGRLQRPSLELSLRDLKTF